MSRQYPHCIIVLYDIVSAVWRRVRLYENYDVIIVYYNTIVYYYYDIV